MKISLIISDISKSGGTERSVSTLANMLCKKYEKVEIISVIKTNTKKSYYDIDSRVSVKFLGQIPLASSLLSKIKWSVSTVVLLRKYFNENNSNLIISTGHNYNWLLPFIKIRKKVKIIACEHIVYKSIPKVSRIFMSSTYSFLDGIVVLSDKAKESFKKYSMIFVIPNSLPFKVSMESELTSKQILVVGRLSAEKGLERLIPVSNKLKEKFPDWHITIVGEGPEKEKLSTLISEANLRDVLKLNGISNNVENFYLESSIYIMTSHFEAFPMVLLEAQSFGLPVIAYDCPEGPGQIINNGENGYLIENDNVTDFSDKLFMLIEDEELRKKIGKNAKSNSLNFTEERIIKKWMFLFDELK
ncbi:glycosyltransferase family 4 protein [Flavobacterium piscisymbiosum]|uniref:Glycosyltransferase family 4 protein n=1 Tax=Flavobacterium piscisymbiosum TaxID=2893753 RepID=A0ABS8M8B6_9FLAO|nr:glycosyltransferase family 4 protein [Flavobacterium sp. F-30]MCC9061740.1 glycosyltransferase family 4 protein [Flavobacterium sp. F-30]